MTTTNPNNPGRDIPLSEVPATIRELREAWAREFTRANQLDALLERAYQAVNDWQAIAIQNGEDLAKAKVALAVANDDRAAWMKMSQDNFARADRLAKYIEHVHEHAGEDATWPHVRDLIEESGVECDECRGDGVVITFEDILVGDMHTTRDATEECHQCLGIGKVLR